MRAAAQTRLAPMFNRHCVYLVALVALAGCGRVTVVRVPGSANLSAVSVDVPGNGRGTATLTWAAPTRNTDGSALSNLAGYFILYRTTPGAWRRLLQVGNPATGSVVVGGLGAGTHYFAVTAYSLTGFESDPSNVASKQIAP